MREVKIIRSARKHRVTVEQILEALNNAGEPVKSEPGQHAGEIAYSFIGTDRQGEEIEIVAIEQPRWLLIIHAMPTRWRNT
ncbi:MAG: hypothetical protein WA006_01305 [Rhodoglobus sp.]